MSHDSHVVIIGAGIVGVNVADELLERGWTDITVIEQGPLALPGGSTSHAPGLVFQVTPSKTMTDFASYTVNKLLKLEKDGENCFNQVGGLEVATTEARLEELKRKHGQATSWGIDTQLLTTDQCMDLYPHLNRQKILGGFFIPSDGLALAARATEILIERTQQSGVRYLGHTPVIGIEKANGRVTGVIIPDRTIRADIVISCAGFWGVEVGAMAGVAIPLLPLAHQYVKTTAVPALADRDVNTRINGKNAELPILRHQDRKIYFREHGGQYGIGSYAHRPMPVDASSLGWTPKHVDHDNMPSRLDFTSADFDLPWKECQEILPAIRGTQIADAFNGIFSFTPDGGPLIGEAPNLDGFFVAEAVWVTHSAGVARALAEILTTGHSTTDLHGCELSRFEEVQLTHPYVSETSQTTFADIYGIMHPLDQRSSPRNLRVSPFFQSQRRLGAYFVEAAGWERPYFYSSHASLAKSLPSTWKPTPRDQWAAKHFDVAAVAVEAYATRTAAAIYDLTAFHRFDVGGPGAAALLQGLVSSALPKKGSQARALVLHGAGGIETELVLVRLREDKVIVIANSATDLALLQRLARKSSSPVNVTDITSATCAMGIAGPHAEAVLRAAGCASALPTAHGVVPAVLSGLPVHILGWRGAGEGGWVVIASADTGSRLWDAFLVAGRPHGLLPAGRYAMDALALEAGRRAFGRDYGSEHSPAEAGISHLDQVRHDKGFRSIIATEKLRLLTIDDGRTVFLGAEPVYTGTTHIGRVTAGTFGYSIGRPVALAWLPADAKEGDKVEVEYFGRRYTATVAADKVFDAKLVSTGAGEVKHAEFVARL